MSIYGVTFVIGIATYGTGALPLAAKAIKTNRTATKAILANFESSNQKEINLLCSCAI
jgi:hypothetical protein